MRLEAKHSYFKSVNRAVHNNINKTKQLANRHQYLQAYHLLMPNYFNEIELGCIKNLDLTYTSLFELLLNKTNIDYYNWIIKRGIKYCINDFIVTSYDNNNFPIFSEIKGLTYLDETVYFIVQEMETIQYLKQFASFEIDIKADSLCKIVKFNELRSCFPINSYDFKIDNINKQIITPKYLLGIFS